MRFSESSVTPANSALSPGAASRFSRFVAFAFLAASLVLVAQGMSSTSRAAGAAPAASAAAGGRPTFNFKDQIRPLFEKYCVECHSGSDPEAGLDVKAMIDASGVDSHRKVWEKALSLVRIDNMPPADAAQPTKEERELLVRWMDDALFYVDCRKPADPGRVTVRRLNRSEYNNSIRDLLNIDFHPADSFPQDDVGYGFDNIGDVLTVPPLLIEKYLDASEEVVRRAIVTPETLQTDRVIRATDFINDKSATWGMERESSLPTGNGLCR